ncbi:hypothetical protein V2J52_08760 [Georgenia sp. MJ173]|uniref:hypothetical protein n=1 Tax=Georgenia sunbinii TaxID=3117728 RepID=UPI002F26513C
MSPATTPRLGGRISSTAPQWARSSKWYLQVYAFLGVWMWAIVLPATVVILLITDRVGTVDVSILQFVRNGPGIWMLFAVAVIVTTGYLPFHVANGLTRRSAIRGALLAALLGSLLFSVPMSLAVLAEGAVYDAMGWAHDATSGADAAAGVWQQGFGPMLLDYTLACLSGAVAGLLVGMAYYRAGGWWGTLALPLTVLPALAVTFLGGDTQLTFGSWVLTPTFGTVVTVVLILAGGFAFVLLARNVPIARKES